MTEADSIFVMCVQSDEFDPESQFETVSDFEEPAVRYCIHNIYM